MYVAIALLYLNSKILKYLPKYEYEEYEQREEDSNIVHSAQHDEQLAAQVGHEPHQLKDAQESESAQHGQARAAGQVFLVSHALSQLESAMWKEMFQ